MFLRTLITTAKQAYITLIEKNPLVMAGATSFFTTFALPPIFIILIQGISLFYNSNAVKKDVFNQLVSVLGKESSINIYTTLTRFQNIAHNWLIASVGFIFLLFLTVITIAKDINSGPRFSG